MLTLVLLTDLARQLTPLRHPRPYTDHRTFDIAIPKKAKGQSENQPKRMKRKWWPRAESNHRHTDFQSAALPTGLLGHFRSFNHCEHRCRGTGRWRTWE